MIFQAPSIPWPTFDRSCKQELKLISPDSAPEYAMHTHRFGRKLKLPSTTVIKLQIRKMMFEDLVKEAEARPVEQITKA